MIADDVIVSSGTGRPPVLPWLLLAAPLVAAGVAYRHHPFVAGALVGVAAAWGAVMLATNRGLFYVTKGAG